MGFWSALARLFKGRKPKPPAPPQVPLHWVHVHVDDDATGMGLSAATVTLSGHRDVTNEHGDIGLLVPVRSVDMLEISKDGYVARSFAPSLGSADIKIGPIVLDRVAAPKPARATGDLLLHVLGNFCNLWDSAGRIVYTPALPGAVDAGCYDEWMQIQRDAGSRHVFFGPFDGGAIYPGIPFHNPDLLGDPVKLRAFVEKVLDTPSADSLGFRPVIFLDSGASDPRPRIDRDWPRIFAALDGLQDFVIVVPAWEPVVGSWTSAEVSYALKAIPAGWVIGYHGSPKRLVGSSNPVEPDDPWQGGEADFYLSHGGERIQVAFYQTEHGHAIYSDCSEDSSDCWLDRWQDYVYRIGAGHNGWRVLSLVFYESVAYEAFRGQATAKDARDVASRAQRIADKWGVRIGHGNGLPN